MSIETLSNELEYLNLAESSAIYNIISNIKEQLHPKFLFDQHSLVRRGIPTALYNYVTGFTIARTVIYIEASIKSDSLDKGIFVFVI